MQNHRVTELLATFFYLGRAPYMKGTIGTLGAIPFVFLFSLFGGYVYMLLTFATLVLALVVCEAYDMMVQNHDAPEVVIDEVAGYLIAMMWLPMTWQAFLYSFILFRFLDIVKPPPISTIDQKVRGGFGVVLDDALAGVVANFILQIVYSQTDWLGVIYSPGL